MPRLLCHPHALQRTNSKYRLNALLPQFGHALGAMTGGSTTGNCRDRGHFSAPKHPMSCAYLICALPSSRAISSLFREVLTLPNRSFSASCRYHSRRPYTGCCPTADSANANAQKKSACPSFSSCAASKRTCPRAVVIFLTLRKFCHTIWSSGLPSMMTVSGSRHLHSSSRRFVCVAIVSFVCCVNVIPSTFP